MVDDGSGPQPLSESVLPKNNYTAGTPPTPNDDSSQGYSRGSAWVQNVTKEAYRCVDASVGAAEWIETTLDGEEVYSYIDARNRKFGYCEQFTGQTNGAEVIDLVPSYGGEYYETKSFEGQTGLLVNIKMLAGVAGTNNVSFFERTHRITYGVAATYAFQIDDLTGPTELGTLPSLDYALVNDAGQDNRLLIRCTGAAGQYINWAAKMEVIKIDNTLVLP